jgi:hypothetical protein
MHVHFDLKYIGAKLIERQQFLSLDEDRDYFEIFSVVQVVYCLMQLLLAWGVGLPDLMCSCYLREPQRNVCPLFLDYEPRCFLVEKHFCVVMWQCVGLLLLMGKHWEVVSSESF